METQTQEAKTRKTKKFRKFRREHKEKEVPLEIQARDIAILNLVYKYRFLNADHIRCLMKTSKKAVSHRLTKLYRAGYLDRPIEQVRLYYRHDYKKSEPIIYALGNRGADVLAQVKQGQIDGLDWKRKNHEVKDRTLLHDLGVANFGVVLRLAMDKDPETHIHYWLQDRQDRDQIKDKVLVYNKKKKEEETQTIIPDAVFRLQYPKGRPLFFLEYYREILTNNKKYLEEKLLRYAYYYKQERHKQKYEARHFRVITMVPTAQRARNLIAMIKEDEGLESLDNWRYWFVCADDFDIARPESILEPIFLEAGDCGAHRILE